MQRHSRLRRCRLRQKDRAEPACKDGGDGFSSFLEGTNLTKQAQTYSTGGYRPYADGTPVIMRLAYSGMRVRTGVTFKFQ